MTPADAIAKLRAAAEKYPFERDEDFKLCGRALPALLVLAEDALHYDTEWRKGLRGTGVSDLPSPFAANLARIAEAALAEDATRALEESDAD